VSPAGTGTCFVSRTLSVRIRSPAPHLQARELQVAGRTCSAARIGDDSDRELQKQQKAYGWCQRRGVQLVLKTSGVRKDRVRLLRHPPNMLA